MPALADDEDSQILRKQKLSLKQQQEKISAHLAALSEAKKAEEIEKKQLEERSRRRKELLRNRLQQESNERKLMALNDKPIVQRSEAAIEKKIKAYPSVPSKYANTNNPNTSSAIAAVKNSNNNNNGNGSKISPEVAEAAVQRLTAVKATAGPVSTDGTIGGQVAARDFADWKRKHSVPSDGKVFGTHFP